MADSEHLFSYLTSKNITFIIRSVIVVSLVMIAITFFVIWHTIDNFKFSENDIKSIKSLSLLSEKNQAYSELDYALYDSVIKTQTHLKNAINSNFITCLSFICGLFLFMIGFLLFLIGAEGMVSIKTENPNGLKFVFAGTAPGLACFLAGTVIIVSGLNGVTKFEPGDFKYNEKTTTKVSELSSETENIDQNRKSNNTNTEVVEPPQKTKKNKKIDNSKKLKTKVTKSSQGTKKTIKNGPDESDNFLNKGHPTK